MDRRAFKRWRQGQFLSQVEVAMLFDVTESTIKNWERGTYRVPKLAELACEAISQARATQVRKLRAAREELAHKRRLKAIAQGVRDPR